MRIVRLDDEQIERYSRQIVLPELGVAGQTRLLEARIAVLGREAVAGPIVAQLVAAGVGRIAAPTALHGHADPAGPARLGPLESLDVAAGDVDAMVLVEPNTQTPQKARHTLWLADDRVGETPPCAACATRALPPTPECPPELTFARSTLLGAMLATETVKRIAGVGTPLAGQVLTYDPTTATVTTSPVTFDQRCPTCASASPED